MKTEKVISRETREIRYIATDTKKMIYFNNTKKVVVYNAEIVEDGKKTGFYCDFEQRGIVDDIEVKLNSTHNNVKWFYVFELVHERPYAYDFDGEIWHKVEDYVKENPSQFFYKNGNWRKHLSKEVKDTLRKLFKQPPITPAFLETPRGQQVLEKMIMKGK